jgi:methyl-accepting chemotaxis protein
MGIRGKLLIGFLVVLALPAVAAIYGISGSARVAHRVDASTEELLPRLQESAAILTQLGDMEEAYKYASLSGDPEALERARSLASELEAAFGSLREVDGSESLASLHAAFTAHARAFGEIVASILEEGDSSDLMQEVARRVDEAEAIANGLRAYREQSNTSVAEQLVWVKEQTARNRSVALACLLCALLVGVAAAFFVSRRMVVESVLPTMQFAEGLTQGDLTRRLESGRKDELGQVFEALNRMTERLAKLVGDVREAVTTLGGSAEELAPMAGSMEETAETLDRSAGVLQQVSDELTTGVTAVATAVEQTSVNVAEVSKAAKTASSSMAGAASDVAGLNDSVQTVTAASGELSCSLEGVSESSQSSARKSEQALRVAEEATATVSELGASAEEIGSVAKVIMEIAEQTNLLALNATIEAASAGEAGRGFAVVASEVKELAKQTATATSGIHNTIRVMQTRMNSAVEAIGRIAEIIRETNDGMGSIALAVDEQTQVARRISDSMTAAADRTGNLTHATRDAAGAVEVVARNIDEIRQSAEEIAQSAGRTAGASADLKSTVEAIRTAANDGRERAGGTLESARQIARQVDRVRILLRKFKG